MEGQKYGTLAKTPCYGCEPPKRQLGCHGTCKPYICWKAEYDKAMKKARDTMIMKTIHDTDFTGTSPKPGSHRKTRRT